MTSIGTEAFAKCSELLDVYCYAEKVPSTESDAFDDSYPEDATLHVPDASIDSYKATAPWSSFGKIVGLSRHYNGNNYEAKRVKELEHAMHQRQKAEHRAYFKANRGRFARLGLTLNSGLGPAIYDYSIGVGMRLGWQISFFNLFVGAEIQRADYLGKAEPGHLRATRLNIPMALRLNLMRKYDRDLYLSLGAHYNVAAKGCYGKDTDEKGFLKFGKDRKIVNNGTFSPRVALGFTKKFFEVEAWGLWELQDGIFNRDHILAQPYYALLIPDHVDKQIENKYRIGLSFRFLF